MDPGRVAHFEDREALRGALTGALRAGDIILVKGSRGMQLDKITEVVEKEWA
jgi:UDP-N-acetylmuramyl pentapeptide synthase